LIQPSYTAFYWDLFPKTEGQLGPQYSKESSNNVKYLYNSFMKAVMKDEDLLS